MPHSIDDKLSAARTRLILDKPFLGALVLRLPLVEADPRWCRTAATDAKTLYYNAGYIDALNLEQVKFVLAHLALHCALSHFARRQHRVEHRWDVACDYAVNPLLIDEGLTPPPGTLVEESFKGMTAEEIYPCIDEDPEVEPMDQHLFDQEQRGDDAGQGGGEQQRMQPEPEQQSQPQPQPQPDGAGDKENSGKSTDAGEHGGGVSQPPPLTANERETLSVQWQQRMAGAAQQAMHAGKLGATMARLLDHLLQPQLPWRMLLARYMSAAARDDYSYTRPSSRREGFAILPSLRSAQVEVAVAVDTSGSVSDEEINQFIAEVNGLKGQVRARLSLFACDAELAAGTPWCFEPWEELVLPEQLPGGGGTRFTPVFDWLKGRDGKPDLLVYFTDGNGEFPKTEPPYPVIWLIKGKSQVPWGQRIQLN